jgi:type III pantothenate kinase
MVVLPAVGVDIGNTRAKVGLFDRVVSGGLPEPKATCTLPGRIPDCGRLLPWLEEIGVKHLHWWVGSVNRPATTRLLDWLRQYRPADAVTLLSAGDLPLVVSLPRPDMVGIDRLLAAVAANRLRPAKVPAIIADLGTAITVDLVSASGEFLGGAILPGIAMSARAMHEFTDLLPLVEMSELSEPPAALGSGTVEAMRAGLYWMAVGAIRQLIAELSGEVDRPPQVYLTGGAGPAVAELLGCEAQYVSHLTLAGIALVAAGRST